MRTRRCRVWIYDGAQLFITVIIVIDVMAYAEADWASIALRSSGDLRYRRRNNPC